jgi:hypothetical protein
LGALNRASASIIPRLAIVVHSAWTAWQQGHQSLGCSLIYADHVFGDVSEFLRTALPGEVQHSIQTFRF